MSTQKPQRSPAEIEDIILRKILLVNLVHSTETDSRIVYLETTAAEILSEGKELRLSRVLTERVLIDRLSGSFPSAESPLPYLVGCYRRACDEAKKIANMKDESLRSHMECAVKEAKKLAVSYCRIHLGNPNMFPSSDPSPPPLLPLVFSEVSDDGFGGSGGSRSGFLEDLLKDSDNDSTSLEPSMNKLYLDLRDSVSRVSVLGNFQQPLRAMLLLVTCSPLAAKFLVNHPLWNPKGPCLNGRVIETTSILGPFFHVSALPDHSNFKSLPDVGQQCFAYSPTRHPDDLLPSFASIKSVSSSLHDGLARVLLCLLKNAETRDSVLDYLAQVINKNASRANIQVDPLTCASSGMFLNLSAVMLRLCEPFLDMNLTKLDKIDPSYVFYGTRLDLQRLTALHASSEEVVDYLIKDIRVNPKYNFICECFFMTARVLNLGILRAFSDLKQLDQDMSRCDDTLADLMELRGSSPQLDADIARLEEEVDLFSQEGFCYEAQILNNQDLIRRALSFYRLVVVWLISLAGGFKMPLPSTCPMEFRSIPEHFVEDALEFLIFAPRIPKSLDGVILDDFMNFIIMFMASPGYIRSPYLRAKMVEVLISWTPQRSRSSSTASLFESHQVCIEHLVRNLLKLYVDMEFTGSHEQFYDKFNIRHNIAELLGYLWKLPGHRTVWKRIAKEEEKGVYLNFLNYLINDSIHLLDESLNKILEIKEIEAEMGNAAEWEKRPALERQERLQLFNSHEKIISADMTLANEDVNMLAFTSEEIKNPFLLPEMVERVASMLNYFLLQLVGPRRKSLSLKDPEKYEFRPKLLIKDIVTIYVNLARGDGENIFPNAIIKDGRSYSEELFGAAADVLRRICEDGRIVQEFVELGEKAKFAAAEAMDVEAALGEIPEEFLDPIQYTLMKDPVVLPSSKVTVDRTVIQRHLLSGGTDPFNRSHLTADMLIPDNELKGRIEEFVRRSRHKVMA